MVDSARQIRKQALQDFSISKVFSTRHVVDFCLVVSRMPSKYLKHNIENVIINKLGENQEEKKSIAMILDGKMFETKLRNILSPNHEKKANLSEKSDEQQPEKPAIQIMRNCVQNYINQYGIGSVLRKNGKVKWKLFDWLWFNNRGELQEYVKLTVEFGYHEEYTKTTGKYHLYKKKVSLAYIRWLYREKNDEFEKFLMDTHKIL